MIYVAEFQTLKGDGLVLAKTDFIERHKDVVRHAFNQHRNYLQTQMQNNGFKRALKSGEWTLETLPTPEELEMVMQRQGLEEGSENLERNQKVFDFYWDVLVPVVSGNKRWSSGKRWHCLMSTARPNGDPDQQLYVAPSGEAFAVLMWEN